jgi:hypothetical protein
MSTEPTARVYGAGCSAPRHLRPSIIAGRKSIAMCRVNSDKALDVGSLVGSYAM